jgi:hypothetical protein
VCIVGSHGSTLMAEFRSGHEARARLSELGHLGTARCLEILAVEAGGQVALPALHAFTDLASQSPFRSKRVNGELSVNTARHALSSPDVGMQPVWNYFRIIPRAKSQCDVFAVRTTATRGSALPRVDLSRTSAATIPRRRW